MNILAIDSSGLAASCAILSDDVIRADFFVCNKLTHSETLLPMVDQVIEASGLKLAEMDAIAVSMGPGSFTGLRIGSATAKGLAEAIQKPVIGVPTVDALACNMAGYEGNIVPLMDARRNETYTGIYSYNENGLTVLREQCAVPLTDIIEEVNQRGIRTVFLGDGVRVFGEQIIKDCRVPFEFAPASHNLQRASCVAVLAGKYHEQGRYTDAAGHVPVYLRTSQAEREKQERDRTEAGNGKAGA